MVDLDENDMAKLAREMVMGIRNYKTIFADFGIDEADYYEIAKNETYKRIKEHFTLEWNATTSTQDRIRLQGAAGIEVIMPVVARRALDATTPLAEVIESAKFMAKIAGIGNEKGDQKINTEKFVISINLGSDLQGKPVIEHYEKAIAVDENPVKPI
jgi:hypothetical protein